LLREFLGSLWSIAGLVLIVGSVFFGLGVVIWWNKTAKQPHSAAHFRFLGRVVRVLVAVGYGAWILVDLGILSSRISNPNSLRYVAVRKLPAGYRLAGC
jgi:uncharacterized iron-regulated membrane protein